MNSIREVTIEIHDANNFHNLFEVYEEIAAQKMQTVRDEIISFREYYSLLKSISAEIGSDIGSVIKKRSKQKVTVLISSDKGLFGSAFNDTVKSFLDSVEKDKTDSFVVGSIGLELLKTSGTKIPFTYVSPDEESIKKLMSEIVQYQEINIFYLKFDSIAHQNADTVHLSGDALPLSKNDYAIDSSKKLSYLYEPSAIEISQFFANKILVFLTEQTIKESDLAKYAARLMYLDSCIEKNKIHLHQATKKRMILNKRFQNKRQNARMINYITRSRGGL